MIWMTLNILLLLAIALSFQPEEGSVRYYWMGLFIKFAAAIAFGLYYFTYLKSGDTVAFHEKALELYQLSEKSFNEYIRYLFTGHHPVYMAEGRNDFFVKILSIPYVASRGNYWVSSFYLAFFSFTCSWFLFRSIIRYFPHLLIPAFIAFLVWPTSIFWSAGAMKDTLVNGSVFFLAGICIRYQYGYSFKFSQVTMATACLFMLFYMKFYLAAVVDVCMGLLAWDKLAPLFIANKQVQYLSGVLILIACIGLSSQLNSNMNMDKLPEAIADNYARMQSLSEPHETITFQLDGSYASLIKNMPHALYAGLFRPAIWQTKSWLMIFGLETVLIYVLVLSNVFFYQHIRVGFLGVLALLFILSLATLLPMASPNLGSLVRYRAVYTPFLIFLLLQTPYQAMLKKNTNE